MDTERLASFQNSKNIADVQQHNYYDMSWNHKSQQKTSRGICGGNDLSVSFQYSLWWIFQKRQWLYNFGQLDSSTLLSHKSNHDFKDKLEPGKMIKWYNELCL